jgi:hypothetical protein
MKNPNTTPVGLLNQIADIQSMEPGKLCVMRAGKGGPYYNLQWRKNGKPISRYVPRKQAEAVENNTANYRKFCSLVDEYAEQIIERTRQERMAGQKKSPRSNSTSAKRKRSSS